MCIPGIGGVISFSIVYSKKNKIKDFSISTYYMNFVYCLMLIFASFIVFVVIEEIMKLTIDNRLFLYILYIITGIQFNLLFYWYYKKYIKGNI